MTPLLVAVLAFVAIGAIAFAFLGDGDPGGEKAAKRAKQMSNPRKGRRDVALTSEMAAQQKRKATNAEALKELGDRQKRSRKSMLSIRGQIAQAGLTFSELHFWLGSAAIGAGAAIGAYLMKVPPIFIVCVFVAAGLGVPRWTLQFLRNGRQKKFAIQMADSVDIIVRGIKSGLPLNQCLRIIAAESPQPVRGEFQSIVDGQQMGVPLEQNLQKMYERMPLPEVNFFNIVLIIQQKAGGNLSEALGNLSTVLRSRRMLKEKIKALSSEAKASAMIIGSLPIIVMVLVYFTRPDYIMMLFTHKTGHLILLGSATMMAMGVLVMRNMINFKF